MACYPCAGKGLVPTLLERRTLRRKAPELIFGPTWQHLLRSRGEQQRGDAVIGWICFPQSGGEGVVSNTWSIDMSDIARFVRE
jgi:hypothetical protein